MSALETEGPIIKPVNNPESWKEGDELTCTYSGSCAYKVGDSYKVVKQEGVLGLIGRDGLFDKQKKLVSRFKKNEGKGRTG